MGKTGEKFEKLLEIMKTLRGPNGCDWDKKQTHESLIPYLIEESYELVEEIKAKNYKNMAEELGDILLQVIFHSQIATENNSFTIDDVIDTLIEKLIRRHPHVFGTEKEFSYKRWEKIKALEKGEKKYSIIGKVNKSLPALSLSRRIQENAATVGFDWNNIEDVYDKVYEELNELKKAKNDYEIEEEFGDLLFSLVNLSRFLKVDPEVSLRKATEKFIKRFQKMEELILKDGKKLENLSIDELNQYWEESKN
ncbi:pyrophosphatase [Thermosipho melanesiensis]|uniref:MazG family protein n=2 Tax=Thermosipho melanesiensis TaxID=46541 RepID=A6LN62_THEM4|nr:nucleoside triphosphate pyrophosphohydrolase [Thermosipho melanesiensis]ABR31363.1 MazG family protein [Thermosipho melanesiensis BI429]APT74423.1 pyrophosphatase [Thermosipho melanesiensis]OOC36386.1 pyrophosphatase [Thermosipho melanesiensis]OOC37204.1 pyrophosphatase [Thermosipho melanesiensis]OOC37956.1 pyrophosphatase [Thermosipho melanesiensis]